MNFEIRNLPHFIFEALSVLLLVCCFIPIFSYKQLEGTEIPTHYAADGTPDASGGSDAIFLLPALTAFIFGILTVAERRPKLMKVNMPFKLSDNGKEFLDANGWKYLREIKLCCMLLMAYLSYWTYVIGIGKAESMPIWGILLSVGLMLAATVRFTYLVYNWN